MSNAVEFSINAVDNFSAVMNKQSNMMAKMAGVFAGLGIAAAAYAAVKLVQKSLDNAEAMGTMAAKANMSAETFSALAHAAKFSNVETGSLAAGLRILGKAVAEGDASPAGQALDKLGIASRTASGSLRPTVDVLYDVADAFGAAKIDAAKTKVAMDVFGKAGTDLIPMLNGGSKAIKDMMEEAKKLGMVISDDFAKAADDINDNLATMTGVIDGSVNVAMSELAPVISILTNEMKMFLTEGDSVQTAGGIIAGTMKIVLSAVTIASASFRQLGIGIGAVSAAIVAVATRDYKQAGTILMEVGKDLKQDAAETTAKLKGYWDGSAHAAAKSASETSKAARAMQKSLKVVSKEDAAASKAKEDLAKSIDDTVKSMNSAIQTSGMSASATKRYELSLRGVKDAQLKALDAAILLEQQNEKNIKSLDAAAAIVAGLRTEHEKFNLTQSETKRIMKEAGFSSDQISEALSRQQKAWDIARKGSQEYRDGVTDAMGEANILIESHIRSLGSVSNQIGLMIKEIALNMIKGVGDAVASAIISGKSLEESFVALKNTILHSMISTLVQIGIQRLILNAGIIASYIAEAAASVAASTVMVSGGTAVSIAWAPITLIALAIAAALYLLFRAVELYGADAVAWGVAFGAIFLPMAISILAIKEVFLLLRDAFKNGVPSIISFFQPFVDILKMIQDAINKIINSMPSVSAISDKFNVIKSSASDDASRVKNILGFDGGGNTGSGSRSGGLDGIGGFLGVLHPNETIIDNSKGLNIGGGGGGGGSSNVVIQNLTVHVMENATNAEVFKNMNKVQLRNAIGQPVVDALNEMFSIGVRPNFANQVR